MISNDEMRYAIAYNDLVGIERLDRVPELLLRLAVLGRMNKHELVDGRVR